MSADEQTAFLTLALLAVFANGGKDERELAQLRHVLERLSPVLGTNLSLVLQDVQLKRRTVDTTVGTLRRPESRQLVYEMAVCVCDVDGVHSDSEHRFLEDLRIALNLDLRAARSLERAADAIADLTLQPEPVRGFGAPMDTPDSEVLNQGILGLAALCGALAATGNPTSILAITPMQMKMIYRVARAYGEQAARGQIKDLMILFGAAALPQYIESFGLSIAGRQAQATAAIFATTYALGHTAQFYYGAEPDMDAQAVREQFERSQRDGLNLSGAHATEIDAKQRTLAANELMALLRQQ
ncbi:MAG TPA: hypothetical protein VJU83_00240 [Burkholderiales bacterium]|nr:hypothetical protein [Burkholderiales bacterium]